MKNTTIRHIAETCTTSASMTEPPAAEPPMAAPVECVYADVCTPDYNICHVSTIVKHPIIRFILHEHICEVELMINIIDTKRGKVIYQPYKHSVIFRNNKYTSDRRVMISRVIDLYGIDHLHKISASQLLYIGYSIINGRDSINEILKPEGLSTTTLADVKYDDMSINGDDHVYKLCSKIVYTIGDSIVDVYAGIFDNTTGYGSYFVHSSCKFCISKTSSVCCDSDIPEYNMRDVIMNFFNLSNDTIQKKLAAMD